MISRLSDPERPNVPLVLDASVVINLLATGQVEVILGTLPHAVVVEEIARLEVRRNPRDRGSAQQAIQALADAGLLAVEAMDGAAETIFFELTGAAPPNDLGDGEAATIAHAITIGGGVAIDERKRTEWPGSGFRRWRGSARSTS